MRVITLTTITLPLIFALTLTGCFGSSSSDDGDTAPGTQTDRTDDDTTTENDLTGQRERVLAADLYSGSTDLEAAEAAELNTNADGALAVDLGYLSSRIRTAIQTLETHTTTREGIESYEETTTGTCDENPGSILLTQTFEPQNPEPGDEVTSVLTWVPDPDEGFCVEMLENRGDVRFFGTMTRVSEGGISEDDEYIPETAALETYEDLRMDLPAADVQVIVNGEALIGRMGSLQGGRAFTAVAMDAELPGSALGEDDRITFLEDRVRFSDPREGDEVETRILSPAPLLDGYVGVMEKETIIEDTEGCPASSGPFERGLPRGDIRILSGTVIIRSIAEGNCGEFTLSPERDTAISATEVVIWAEMLNRLY